MGFGMSFKLAPGVRVRVSSRGVRTSVGPRAARLHIGGGPPRISSGVGPFSFSDTVGPVGRSRTAPSPSPAPARPSLAELRQAAAAEREQEIRSVIALERSLLTLHLQEFTPTTRPLLPPPAPPDPAPFIAAREQQALDGLSIFDRAKRRDAQQWARDAGQHDADVQWEQTRRAHLEQQHAATQWWDKLVAHDETTVHATLEAAFEDNQSLAACIDVGKDLSTPAGIRYATVLIIYGPVDLVPEKQPGTTPAGRPTLRRRTQSARNDFYVQALGSTVLATVREGLAVAPSVTELRVVVLRRDPGPPTRRPTWNGSTPVASRAPGSRPCRGPPSNPRKPSCRLLKPGCSAAARPAMSSLFPWTTNPVWPRSSPKSVAP